MKLYPPLMVLIGLLVQLGIAFGGPVQPLLSAVWQYAGVALMLLGFLTILLLARKFGRTETTILPDGDPSHLMEDGLFAYSRNPIYVAMALLLTGSGLATGQIWGLGVVPVFIFWVQIVWIAKEEENMEREFGQLYRNYKDRVRRWI